MHGALQGYLFFGFRRIMQQAPYFAVPFGLGELNALSLCGSEPLVESARTGQATPPLGRTAEESCRLFSACLFAMPWSTFLVV